MGYNSGTRGDSRTHEDTKTRGDTRTRGGTRTRASASGGTLMSYNGGTPSSGTRRDDGGDTSTPNAIWDRVVLEVAGLPVAAAPATSPALDPPPQSHQLCTSWTEGVRRTRSGSRLISFMMLERRTGSSCRRKAKEVFSQALLEPGKGGTDRQTDTD